MTIGLWKQEEFWTKTLINKDMNKYTIILSITLFLFAKTTLSMIDLMKKLKSS